MLVDRLMSPLLLFYLCSANRVPITRNGPDGGRNLAGNFFFVVRFQTARCRKGQYYNPVEGINPFNGSELIPVLAKLFLHSFFRATDN